jgi:GGDEF domain-containing protein
MQATDASYNDAVKRADMALYQAKAAGRNCVAIAPLFASRVA